MKKKLLLTSVAALALFAAYNTADAASVSSVKSNGSSFTVNYSDKTSKTFDAAHWKNLGNGVLEFTNADGSKEVVNTTVIAQGAYPIGGRDYMNFTGTLKYDRLAKNGFTHNVTVRVVDGGGRPVPNTVVDFQIIPTGNYAAERSQFETFQATTDESGFADLSTATYKRLNDASSPYNGSYLATVNGVSTPVDLSFDADGNVVKVLSKDTHAELTNATVEGNPGIKFQAGEVLKYRVAVAPTDFKQAVGLEGQFTVSSDLTTTGKITLPYKDDNRSSSIGNVTAANEGWAKNNADGTWKYFENQKAVTGWKQVSGTWYYFGEDRVMKKWWVNVNGTWYFLNGSGAMQTGWLLDNGKWYFLETSGAMKASQWFQVNNKWYYVNASGELAVNTTVNGYTVNGNGEWVQD